MHLDIRLPIGLLFGTLGAILTVFGVLSNFNVLAEKTIYDRSLGYNVNVLWGIVMLAFGIFMFLMGRRGTSSVHSADESPEGRKLEEVEAAREREDRPRGH